MNYIPGMPRIAFLKRYIVCYYQYIFLNLKYIGVTIGKNSTNFKKNPKFRKKLNFQNRIGKINECTARKQTKNEVEISIALPCCFKPKGQTFHRHAKQPNESKIYD